MTAKAFNPAPMPDRAAADRAVNRVAEAAHRLNDAIQRAMEGGYTIELVRVSRCHDGAGNWGDQMVPLVRDIQPSKSAGA